MCTRIDGALGHQTIAIPLPPDRGGGGDMVLGGCISMIESQADVSHWERYSLGVGLHKHWFESCLVAKSADVMGTRWSMHHMWM